MAIKIKLARYIDVTIFDIEGRISLGEGSVLLRNAVRESLWNGHKKLAFDYGDVTYQDSSGFGELVSAQTTIANSGGKLVLFGLQPKTRDAFMITKLFTVFEVLDTRDAALAYFDSRRQRALKVTANRYAHVSVLSVEGALTQEADLSKLPAEVDAALDSGARSAIVLFPQVLDIDQHGASALISCRSKVRDQGGDLVLAGIEPQLMPAATATSLVEQIPSYDTVDQALHLFGLALDRSKWRVEAVRAD